MHDSLCSFKRYIMRSPPSALHIRALHYIASDTCKCESSSSFPIRYHCLRFFNFPCCYFYSHIGHMEKWTTLECVGKLLKRCEILVEQRGVEPLTSALRMGLDHLCMVCHAVTCSSINLQFFNRLQPSREQFLLAVFNIEFHRFAESRVTNR